MFPGATTEEEEEVCGRVRDGGAAVAPPSAGEYHFFS